MNYYNEFYPPAAAILRGLIANKLIPEGHVDDRSITEIQPSDIAGYTQCHFFAGIGGWPLALVSEGCAIMRKHDKDIKELLTATKQKMCIGGHWVWAANLPYTMSSEAGHLLCMEAMYPMGSGELNEHPPFGATYYDVADGRIFSLRSVGDFDVSAIAKKYGGGGHKNAAGFKLQNGDTL